MNPNAEEWRPTPTPHPQPRYFLPQLTFHPHSQLPAAASPPPQAVEVAAVTPAPPPPPPPYKLFSQLPVPHRYYYSHTCPSFQHYLPHNIYRQSPVFHYVSFPAEQFSDKAAEAAAPVETEDFPRGNETDLEQQENVKSDEEEMMESPRGKTPKSPCAGVFKKGMRRVLPPRLRRAVRYFRTDKKQPSPPRRRVWRPKKSARPEYKGSGEGGASHSPPPQSCTDYSSQSSNTTVMMKNIPNQLRRDFMLRFLDGYCKVHSLAYDFLYLPMDFRTRDNFGYAFVNFTTTAGATKFKKILQNYKWNVVHTDDGGRISSKKICEITWARIQGIQALIKRFQNSNFTCDELDFLPVILDPPRNGSDPNPTPPMILGRLQGLSKIQ